MNNKIYRVVIVRDNQIGWASEDFYFSEKGALEDIEKRKSDDVKLFGYKAQKYAKHPWDIYEMKEGDGCRFMTVHMICEVVDEQSNKKAVYGTTVHEIDFQKDMTCDDILEQYNNIRQKEVNVLNMFLVQQDNKKCYWHTDQPLVVTSLSNCSGHLDAKVVSIKYPITPYRGILIVPVDDNEYYEVGYRNLQYGDLFEIISNLPLG